MQLGTTLFAPIVSVLRAHLASSFFGSLQTFMADAIEPHIQNGISRWPRPYFGCLGLQKSTTHMTEEIKLSHVTSELSMNAAACNEMNVETMRHERKVPLFASNHRAVVA